MPTSLAPASPVRPFVGPGRVLAGAGSAASTGAELRATGVAPTDGTVLLVGDGAVVGLGLVDPVVASLRDSGFVVDLRPAITAEPTPAMVRALLPDDVNRPVAAVVAVGGGSALDAGKLVALAVANDLDLTAGLPPTADVGPGPPLVAVPTTAGTGAEATAVAMLWHERAKRMFVHPYLVPRVAVLDPELLRNLPPAVTASSGLDAISHAVESLLSTFRTPLTERAAHAALAVLADAVPAAYAQGGTAARYGTLVGAYQAGLALNASVVLGHSVAYVIAARAGLPHGVSCAMALPYCLAHARPAREREIAEMAEIVCGTADGERFVRWLVDANASMGIPASLDAVGIAPGDAADMAAECLAAYPRPNHPVPIERDGLQRLLERFVRGEALEAWHEAGVASAAVGRA